MCVCVSGMHRSVNFFKCQFSVSSMSVAMPSNIVYGKVSCHILVQCSLHASHVEKSVMSCHEKCLSCFSASHMEKVSIMPDALQFVCFTYIYIWKRCLLCHDPLQSACIICRKVSHHIWMHCNLHASHMEKVSTMSQYIAICMHYIQKSVLLCLDTLQFVCFTYGKKCLSCDA